MKKGSFLVICILVALMVFALVFVFAGRTAEENQSVSGELSLNGVSMKTELAYYPEGTMRILAYWENESQNPMMFGDSWSLERLDAKTEEWTNVDNADDKELTTFALRGYSVAPGQRFKHTYDVSVYDENIKPGHYRIRTSFFEFPEGYSPPPKEHDLTAEFTVTSNPLLLKKSELDFADYENSREIYIGYDPPSAGTNIADAKVHVYKNNKTYDTTIVINGDESYRIAEGAGKWGIVACSLFSDGNREYLVYSYSRGEEEHESYIGVFDLALKKEIFRSEAFKGYDLTVNYRESNQFKVASMSYEETEGGGENSSLIENIGWLKYENGTFRFQSEK